MCPAVGAWELNQGTYRSWDPTVFSRFLPLVGYPERAAGLRCLKHEWKFLAFSPTPTPHALLQLGLNTTRYFKIISTLMNCWGVHNCS